MNKLKRAMAVLVAFALVSMLFAGCGSKQDAKSSQSSDQSQSGKPAQKITLKMLKGKAAHEVPLDQMDVFKAYEEKTNIHVQWDSPPAENYLERYNLVMASGDLPDVIMDMPRGDLIKYAQMGAIIPLNDLIEKSSPNLKSWMQKRPEIKKDITGKDGKIFYFPMFDELPLGNNALGLREDWLKKLNLQIPVTPDEWYTVLKAFKEKDPNGNGKADEIPFSGNGINMARSLVSAWGVLDTFYTEPKDGGKVHYGPIEGKYKEALAWIAKLYKEGLIDSEIATNDEKAFQGKMGQNVVGAFRGAFGGHFSAFNSTLPKQIPGFKITGTPPMKGPYGDQVHANLDLSTRSTIAAVITKSNKYQEATTKWIDYFYGQEGALLMNFGIEGKHYTMQNGQPIYTDLVLKNPNGLSSKQVRGSFSITQSTGTYVLLKAQSDQVDDPAVKEIKSKYLEPYIPEAKKFVLPNISFDQKDDEVRRQVMADVQTYVDEMITKFILGTEPLDNWDKYVQKVKGMGIDKAIAVYQKTVDDYKK